jgi:hypothetical protein
VRDILIAGKGYARGNAARKAESPGPRPLVLGGLPAWVLQPGQVSGAWN